MLENYKRRFARGSKIVFVPNEKCCRIGKEVIDAVSEVDLPDYFYHYQSGGHVAALHAHLKQNLFFRIDLKNFYYSISRNRVARALHKIGCPKARSFAKWSCVKNPYADGQRPSYSLPIGFVQSPALASLCLLFSPISASIKRSIADGVTCSLYFDDFICSADDVTTLEAAFADLMEACDSANLPVNHDKVWSPSEAIEAFNCTLKHGLAEVTESRIAQFLAQGKAGPSEEAFGRYVALVAKTNFVSCIDRGGA